MILGETGVFKKEERSTEMVNICVNIIDYFAPIKLCNGRKQKV